MINTYSGEKIEPRVGDVVRWEGHKIVVTHVEGNMIAYFPGDALGFDFLPQSACTLLHRPFQVGDEISELEYEGSASIKDFIIKDDKHRRIIDIFIEDGETILRHKNPSWRDHPDYEGKK